MYKPKSPFDLLQQNNPNRNDSLNKHDSDTNLSSKIIVALERLSHVFRVLLWNESNKAPAYSLSPIQLQVLIFILFHRAEKSKISYLAKEFNLSKASISETVSSLQKKGLVVKIAEPDDNRSFVLQLTEEGEKIAKDNSLFANALQKPIDSLSPQDKEVLLRSLLTVIYELNKSGIIVLQRMCFTCQYYQGQHPNFEHYCKLMELPLKNTDIRVDCEEHTSR